VRLLAQLELTGLTPRTRTRRIDVDQEWRDVARRGVAINQEETIVGAIFIAGAIFDAEHAVCGSISVGIPKARYTPALGRTIAAKVQDSCARLSASLVQVGYLHEDRELHDLR
jgi:DNA-binding IclR family transcriptional regulator